MTKFEFKQSGFFNTRKWKQGAEVKDMPLLQDDETIKFVFIVDEKIEGAEPSAVNNAGKFVYKLKIGKFCRWFNDKGEPIDKPANSVLDGKRAEVIAICSYFDKDPKNPLKASGYWVNNICFRLVDVNPFEGVNFDNISFGKTYQPTQVEQADDETDTQLPAEPQGKEELPF